jgi:hypothetical protein
MLEDVGLLVGGENVGGLDTTTDGREEELSLEGLAEGW